MLGEFQLARERLEKALALSDFRLQPLIARPATPDVMAGVYLGVTLASLGLPIEPKIRSRPRYTEHDDSPACHLPSHSI